MPASKHKKLLLLLIIFISGNSFSQLPDLCGLWLGRNYSCFTVDQNGFVNFYYIDEIILIEDLNGNLTASKITGDPCVPAGNITWQGVYNQNTVIQNTFNVYTMAGNPAAPASAWIPSSIIIRDSSHLSLDFGQVEYYKYSCTEINTLNLGDEVLNRICTDCDFNLYIPNVFSPNNDGINDIFLPGPSYVPVRYELHIYNRWGKLVYFSDNAARGWNGKVLDEPCAEGVYFYIVEFRDEYKNVKRNGTVNLLR